MPEIPVWTTLSDRVVYENAWIRVREDRFVRPDGEMGFMGGGDSALGWNGCSERQSGDCAGWAVSVHAAAVYVGDSARGVGCRETDMLAVAQRELREEAGVRASRWRSLGTVDVCNGVTNDVQHLFLAEDLTLVESEPDPEEELTVKWVGFDEATRMILEGEITEVCSVAANLESPAGGI